MLPMGREIAMEGIAKRMTHSCIAEHLLISVIPTFRSKKGGQRMDAENIENRVEEETDVVEKRMDSNSILIDFLRGFAEIGEIIKESEHKH